MATGELDSDAGLTTWQRLLIRENNRRFSVEMRRGGQAFDAALDELPRVDQAIRSGALTALPRPARKMPKVDAIARYHGLPADHCWCCGVATERPVRAHIIDRALGGLDGPQNLALACYMCNSLGPMFEPEDEAIALQYYGLAPHTDETPPPPVFAIVERALAAERGI